MSTVKISANFEDINQAELFVNRLKNHVVGIQDIKITPKRNYDEYYEEDGSSINSNLGYNYDGFMSSYVPMAFGLSQNANSGMAGASPMFLMNSWNQSSSKLDKSASCNVHVKIDSNSSHEVSSFMVNAGGHNIKQTYC